MGKTKTLTAADLQSQIDEMQKQLSGLAAEQTALSKEIGEKWQGDTSALEGRWSGIQAKIAAGERAIASLQEQRRAALKAETLQQFRKSCEAFAPALQRQNELAAEVMRLEDELAGYKKQLAYESALLGDMQRSLQPERSGGMEALTKFGISADELRAIRSEVGLHF